MYPIQFLLVYITNSLYLLIFYCCGLTFQVPISQQNKETKNTDFTLHSFAAHKDIVFKDYSTFIHKNDLCRDDCQTCNLKLTSSYCIASRSLMSCSSCMVRQAFSWRKQPPFFLEETDSISNDLALTEGDWTERQNTSLVELRCVFVVYYCIIYLLVMMFPGACLLPSNYDKGYLYYIYSLL